MSDWLLNLPVWAMALVVFAAAYAAALACFLVVTRLAVNDSRARAFRDLSPGMLPVVGIIFGLLVGFIAAQVWSDFDRAKLAVANEARALKAVMLMSASFPQDQASELRSLVTDYIETTVKRDWPAMEGGGGAPKMPVPLIQALQKTLDLVPETDGQRTAQAQMASAIEAAFEARRQRIVISQTTVDALKWACLVLQGLCALLVVALAHSSDRFTCGLALAIFATGIALSVLLIAAYSSPFTGDISVRPAPLEQVLKSGALPG